MRNTTVKFVGFTYVKDPDHNNMFIEIGLWQELNYRDNPKDVFYITRVNDLPLQTKLLSIEEMGGITNISIISKSIDRTLKKTTFEQLQKILVKTFKESIWYFNKS